jgi:hypothetical protein
VVFSTFSALSARKYLAGGIGYTLTQSRRGAKLQSYGQILAPLLLCAILRGWLSRVQYVVT